MHDVSLHCNILETVKNAPNILAVLFSFFLHLRDRKYIFFVYTQLATQKLVGPPCDYYIAYKYNIFFNVTDRSPRSMNIFFAYSHCRHSIKLPLWCRNRECIQTRSLVCWTAKLAKILSKPDCLFVCIFARDNFACNSIVRLSAQYCVVSFCHLPI